VSLITELVVPLPDVSSYHGKLQYPDEACLGCDVAAGSAALLGLGVPDGGRSDTCGSRSEFQQNELSLLWYVSSPRARAGALRPQVKLDHFKKNVEWYRNTKSSDVAPNTCGGKARADRRIGTARARTAYSCCPSSGPGRPRASATYSSDVKGISSGSGTINAALLPSDENEVLKMVSSARRTCGTRGALSSTLLHFFPAPIT